MELNGLKNRKQIAHALPRYDVGKSGYPTFTPYDTQSYNWETNSGISELAWRPSESGQPKPMTPIWGNYVESQNQKPIYQNRNSFVGENQQYYNSYAGQLSYQNPYKDLYIQDNSNVRDSINKMNESIVKPNIGFPKNNVITNPEIQVPTERMDIKPIEPLSPSNISAINDKNIFNDKLQDAQKRMEDSVAKTTGDINTKSINKAASTYNTIASGQKISSLIGGAAGLTTNYLTQQNQVLGAGTLLEQAPNNIAYANGIAYNRIGPINNTALRNVEQSGITNTLSSVATGATAGSAFGPWGAAAGAVIGGITGLIGLGSSKSKQRKALQNARFLAQERNKFNQAGAASTGLQQNYYQTHGYTQNGVLYANRGKSI